jgi:glyoxylase-like metal-dependent hydrolase (beta-lactamase superfamily II)
MKIFSLNTNPEIYSSASYLVLGSWNKISDVNAIIDTGSDDYIIQHIEKINTGVGKVPVNKVILTHNHFDHTGGINTLKKKYNAEVLAFTPFAGVDRLLKSGEVLFLGDEYFDIIHTPGHSSDSICLYCKSEGVLFSGDISIRVHSQDGTYTRDYVDSMEKLSRLKIKVVYPGHGEPITENPEKIIKTSLQNMKPFINAETGNKGK